MAHNSAMAPSVNCSLDDIDLAALKVKFHFLRSLDPGKNLNHEIIIPISQGSESLNFCVGPELQRSLSGVSWKSL